MENLSSNPQIHANTLKKLLIVIFSTLMPLLGLSQDHLSTTNKKAVKLYRKADKKYRVRDFESALGLLEEACSLDTGFFETYVRMGNLYNVLGELDSVYSKFNRYLAIAPNPISSVQEKMSYMAFDRGDYNLSMKYLKDFLSKIPDKQNDREVLLLLASQKFALEQIKNPDTIKIIELPKQINQYDLQYLPTMTVDEATLIYTKRDITSDNEDIVVSYKKEGQWSAAVSISSKINTPLNEGASTISADGRTMIFTVCGRKDALGSCDLFIARKNGEHWSKPKNLGKNVNSKYWESQPSLSADGKTLYFTSNRPGGHGGKDIWKTEHVDGTWSKPVNLGGNLNSFKDETTPFIHFNGQSFYFSSNSYPGMGGYDLFYSNLQDSGWSKPVNLGYPINTFRDEVALLISADGSKGYFAKEQLKNREILDSKLVTFSLPNNLRPVPSSYITGKVLDARSKKPLKASIEVFDVSTNKKLYNTYSDTIFGDYYMILPSKEHLAAYVKKEGYLYNNFHFTLPRSSLLSDTLLIELEPITQGQSLVLKNIYFDTNSYKLDNRSLSEIQNVVRLLTENPTITIEIRGHTDDTGTQQYNQSLSEKRAYSVYSAILKKGINKNRITYKGFGDQLPLKKSNDAIDNHQSNRRIEFYITFLRK